MKKSSLINLLIVLGVVVVAIIILLQGAEPQVDEPTAICIGENSIFYIQKGCPHCKTQEEMFGSYKEHLNIIDCFYENEKCVENLITGTPTWVIYGEQYQGVQSIENLKSLTGC